MRRLTALLMLGLALGAVTAMAGMGVTAKLGTLGLGADLTVGLCSYSSARVGLNFMNLDVDVGDESDQANVEDITTELNWQSFPILLDWHPWANGWRVSGGIVINNNTVDLTADSGATVEIGGRNYAVVDVNGEVSFDSVAPYLGFGFGNAGKADGGWQFAFDLGVMFQGEPDVTLDATAANPQLQPILDADLLEEEADIEDDLSSMDLYPVVSVGVSYTF